MANKYDWKTYKSIKIAPKVHDALRRKAVRQGCTIHWMAEKAIREYLRKD